MTDLRELLESCNREGIILDTNILLLYVVGACDKSRISTFKRTQTFAPEDFDTLWRFLQHFRKVATLPNIITEVSNLLDGLTGKVRLACFKLLASAVDSLEEHYMPSSAVSKVSEFGRLGLTDTAILRLAETKYLVLTDDFDLYGCLASKGCLVFNFNHIRVLNWHQ